MSTQTGTAPFAAFRYEKIILAVEETTSAKRCGSSLAAFSRPAHPVQVTGCCGTFFYLLKNVESMKSCHADKALFINPFEACPGIPLVL